MPFKVNVITAQPPKCSRGFEDETCAKIEELKKSPGYKGFIFVKQDSDIARPDVLALNMESAFAQIPEAIDSGDHLIIDAGKFPNLAGAIEQSLAAASKARLHRLCKVE